MRRTKTYRMAVVLGVLAGVTLTTGLLRLNLPFTSLAFAITPPPAPSTPQSFQATPYSYHQISLTWTDVADNTGYKLERSPTGSGSWTTVISNLGANATSYTDSNLTEGTKYFYRLYAYNAGGDSSPATDDTYTKPKQPDTLNVYDVTVNPNPKMRITWVDRSNNEDGFRLERSPNGSNSWTTVYIRDSASAGTGVTLTYDDTSVSYGTRYWYRVVSYLYME